ncbi:MAG: FAD-dependent oxidoreductase [Candidatus Aminicenantes bacterium]|nr:FAD-dependent oxidoreductase [Candidatus Aminicenantes bacterium]
MSKLNAKKEIFIRDGCNACGYCFLICPEKAIKLSIKASINLESCNLCGRCIFVCPCSAIEISENNHSSHQIEMDSTELTENYDTIIIGAGIGGLLTAACLSKMGKKVIVFEKLSFLGGRFSSIPYNGFQISTGAVHMLPYGSKGPFAKILIRLNIGDIIFSSKIFSYYVDNKHFRFNRVLSILSLLSLLEKISLFKLFIKMGIIKSLDGSVSFSSWLSGQTRYQKIFSLFETFSNFSLSLSLKEISYNEMRRILKTLLSLHVPGVPQGGCGNIVKKLQDLIESQNGVIKKKAEVVEIVIEDSIAKGVIVRDRQSGRKCFFECKTIICNNGPKGAMLLIKKNSFDYDSTESIKSIKEANGLKIQFSSNKSLIDHSGIMFCLGTRRIAGIVQPSNADPNLAPVGKHLLISYQMIKSDDIEKEIEFALNDLKSIFNKDFSDHCEVLCISCFKGKWPTNRAIQGMDVSFKTAVHGLYMIGDGCKYPGYIMVEGIAKTVENLLNYISSNDEVNKNSMGNGS